MVGTCLCAVSVFRESFFFFFFATNFLFLCCALLVICSHVRFFFFVLFFSFLYVCSSINNLFFCFVLFFSYSSYTAGIHLELTFISIIKIAVALLFSNPAHTRVVCQFSRIFVALFHFLVFIPFGFVFFAVACFWFTIRASTHTFSFFVFSCCLYMLVTTCSIRTLLLISFFNAHRFLFLCFCHFQLLFSSFFFFFLCVLVRCTSAPPSQ